MANVQLWCLVIVAVAKDPLFKVLYPRLPPPVHTFWPQKEKGRINKDAKHNFFVEFLQNSKSLFHIHDILEV